MPPAYQPAGYCPACGYRIDPGVCPECGRSVPRPARRPPATLRRRVVLGALVLGIGVGGWLAYRNADALAARLIPARYTRTLADSDGWLGRWADTINWMQRNSRFESEQPAFERRRHAIRAELAGLGRHEWAGEYSTGPDYTGSKFILAPDSGFVYSAWGCTHRSLNHGEIVAVTPDSIVLRPEISPEDYATGPDRVLYRVTWRGKRLLVERGWMVEFLNLWNMRESATSNRFPCRGGDPVQPHSDPPEMPVQFARCLHVCPLIAKVVSTGEPTAEPDQKGGACYHVPVVLSVGEAEGAFVGMTLFALDHKSYLGATLNAVREHDSSGVFCDCFDANQPVVLPQVGWSFTTLGYTAEFFTGWYFEDDPYRFDARARTRTDADE